MDVAQIKLTSRHLCTNVTIINIIHELIKRNELFKLLQNSEELGMCHEVSNQKQDGLEKA